MASSANPKSVFIGNVPFSITEEQLKDLLGQAGPVVRLRMLMNPDTGKPRGYGFADFIDADSAAAAVRNLNGLDIQGRKIRVDWPTGSHGDKELSHVSGGGALDAADHTQAPPSAAPNALPPLPSGTDLPPNLKVSDSISATLNALPPAQLLDALTQMKAMALSEPAKATELLTQAPQLSYAIFQALILMNLVDPSVLAQVVQQASQQTQAPPPQQQHYPAYAAPPSLQQPGFAPQQIAQLPQQHTPQPQVPTPAPQLVQPPELTPEQLQQLLALPIEIVNGLPPDQRDQVIRIRAQFGVH
ncbi:hypothetical protein DV738_g1366, partial [Chaetothyriales sp. CBS 135597]